MADIQLRHALLTAGFAIFAAFPAWGTTVHVTSVGFQDVQLVINGQSVSSLWIGEISPEGVKLTAIDNGVATLEVDGRPVSLRPGQSTVSQTVLSADSQGHFVTIAHINGVPVRSLIDTGATHISLTAADAQRMGIDYLRGTRAISQTANGPIPVYLVNLAQVQIGDIVVANVLGSIREEFATQPIPALIGMSFLRHVEMRRSGNTMTLQRADR